ncbi:competence protein ComEC [Desulfuromusa kysingii]|uniref:Competence protein ComEC n=1 Tax=Desulfuromusa kysingii TaxID=37625 RepID=A0A1H4EA76_9BACT|nr:DNA internalization-related competence protein ComEC/Rec2 [Desulfuromusa kysingii]SEA81943.1 competence protein ComEC [Desulfuromusa kysingii]
MQPVPVVLFATVVGLFLAPIYTVPTLPGWLLVFCLGFGSLLLRQHCRVTAALLFLCFFLVSNLHYHDQFPVRHDVIAIDALAQKVEITGELTDLRQLTEGRSWVEVLIHSVALKGESLPLASPLRVRLYLDEGTDQLLPGDIVSCQSRLRKPRLFGTPGEFNWPRYLTSQHVDMTGWVKNIDRMTVLERLNRFPGRTVVQWRSRVAATIQSLMPEDRAYLVRALVLGEGRVIPANIRKTLASSGISHLFAISGLHLGMIALLGYQLLLSIYRRFPRLMNWNPPQRVIPLVLLPLLLFYLLLTGDAVSTRRAFALASLGAIFVCWRYYVRPLSLLASLAFISLLVNPLLFWQAGWQLSFAGAAGILLWQPLWQKLGNNRISLIRYPVQLFFVTSAAMLATLPLVLLNFHLFSFVGVFANLICVPLITLLALPVGFLGLLFYPVFLPLTETLFLVCGFLLEFVLLLAQSLSALPGMGGSYWFLSFWQYLAVATLVLPLLVFPQLTRSMMSRLAPICFLAAILLWQFPLPQTEPISLTMFSVGQGESMLLRNNAGQSILIDGGGFYSDRFDVGERLLAPALGALGIAEFMAVVLTHDDLDHRKGLIFVLNHFPVREFWTGIPIAELHDSLQKALLDNQITVKIVPTGWSRVPAWSVGTLDVYNGSTVGSSKNDSSLVLQVNINKRDGVLLTGDLGQEGVLKLLDEGLTAPVSLLKLPHHGSQFSATDRLVDHLMPQFCLVSVGYQNRYHLPAAQVVHYLRDKDIPLYRTDLSGSLQASLTENGWQVKHLNQGFFVDNKP